MFSSIMKYFATDSVSEGNNGEETSAQQDEQEKESSEAEALSELEKLRRQNQRIKEQLEQKLVLTDAGQENINFDLAELGSAASQSNHSHKQAVAQLLGPLGKGHNREGATSSRKTANSQKKGDKETESSNNQDEDRQINGDKQKDGSNKKLQFQQFQSMKKSKSTSKAKDKMDSNKPKSKNSEANQTLEQSASNSQMQDQKFELDSIKLSSKQQLEAGSSSTTKEFQGKSKDGASNRAQNINKDGRKHEQSDKMQDPITGVLKHKINKNSKKTKEVSLTLNHSNIQQLVQLLQQHTGDSKKDMPDLLDGGDDPSHQQALNLIMQLITNNVQSSLTEDNDSTKSSVKSSIPQGIDPQLLQQLFYIDKEEEECTDSDDYDECESDDEDIDDESDDDDDQDSDQEDLIDDCDDLDDMDTDNDDLKDDYEDEDDEAFENQENDSLKQQDGSSKESHKIKSSQRLQNQLNRQKMAKRKEASTLYNQSSSDEYLNHVDLLSADKASSQQSHNPQKVKEKLQKRKKQLEQQKAQLQNLQQQQKLQQRMQKKRTKQDGQPQDEGSGQFQHKEYQEDLKGQSIMQESIDELKCQEKYIQSENKSKTQQDTTTIDGDNSSQYEDLEYDSEQASSQKTQYNSGQSDYNEASQQNNQKYLKQKLVISDKLSPQFHRFYDQFLGNIDYIIQYEYNILPEQKFYQNFGAQPNLQSNQNNSCYLADQRAREAAESILKKKYDNLRKLCEQNCKCFTGPHSVLQIFIEKIVQAVESFSSKLKGLARDDLQLWVEDQNFNCEDYQSDDNEPNLNELNYSINGIDLNTIFKMQKLTQQQDSEFKQGFKDGLKGGLKQGPTSSVEHKLKQIEMNTKSEEAKQKLRELGKMTDNEISQLVQMADQYLKNKRNSKKFKPLLKNLPNYTHFLQSVIYHYNLIISKYAPAISRHFTEMTQVIKEGNQYEFPSQDIHRTIINKLIINDHQVFRHFFQHMKQEYLKHEKQIKKKISMANNQNQQQTLLKDSSKDNQASGMSKSTINLVKFVEVYEQFIKDVEQDINKGVSQLNIDFYMRDLRKHALEEYDEIFQIEKELVKDDAKAAPEGDNESLDYNEKLNQRYGFMLDAKEKKKLKKKQRKRDKKAKQQAQNADNQGQSDAEEANQENMQKDYDEVFHLSPEVYKNKYEFQDVMNFDVDDMKNMSNKKKKVKGQSKLSQDEIKNLSTDELLSYIESEGKAKKQQMSLLESSQKQVQSNEESSTSPNNGKEDKESVSNQQAAAGESKQIQQMRAKAKAFIEKQQQQKANAANKKEEKPIDPNNFTCKFCNGSVNQKSGKFVHEKFCLVGTQSDKTKGKNSVQSDKKAESSTQASKSTQSSQPKDTLADQYDEEEQHIEEFARKLEQIQKQQPQYRINGSGGQRRRKKLKPNVSNDWVNKLRKTLKSQNQSVTTPCNLADIPGGEIAESSDSMGSYNSSGNSNMAGAQSSSEAQLQKKRTKLSDLTQDHIKFNTQKLNLSVSASQNRKKMQAQASKKV